MYDFLLKYGQTFKDRNDDGDNLRELLLFVSIIIFKIFTKIVKYLLFDLEKIL